jgi:hypothetical protein
MQFFAEGGENKLEAGEPGSKQESNISGAKTVEISIDH